MSLSLNMPFSRFVKTTFMEVFAPDGYDHIYHQHTPLSSHYLTHHYRTHPVILISTFFGLPNDCPPGEIPTWGRIVRNLLGLQDNKSDARNAFNEIVSPLVLLKNLTIAAFKTSQNILKLFTEFLPPVAARMFFDIGEFAGRISILLPLGFAEFLLSDSRINFFPIARLLRNLWNLTKILLGVVIPISLFLAFGALSAAYFIACGVSYAAQFVGRAITSPIDSVRAAWYYCVTPGERATYTRMILGAVFVLASATVTTLAYSLLFPLMLPYLGITTALMTAQLSAGFIAFLTNLSVTTFSASVGLSALQAGLGIFTGLIVSLAGPVINRTINAIKYVWAVTGDAPEPPPPVQQDPVVDRVVNEEPVLHEANINHEFNARRAHVADDGLFGQRSDEEYEAAQPQEENNDHYREYYSYR